MAKRKLCSSKDSRMSEAKRIKLKSFVGIIKISLFLEVGQGQRCLAVETLARAKVTHRKVGKLEKMWCRVRILTTFF